MKRILPLLAVSLLLSACATFSSDDDVKKSTTAEPMYNNAMEELSGSNYAKAVKEFEALEARFPYGKYATQAELEVAYANYKDQEDEAALASLNRFLKEHPTHPSVDYALYLKGLINFTTDRSFFATIADQNMAERDPKAAHESFAAFKELVTRFPNSRYAEDSRDRMAYLVTSLADYDLAVARYYYNRGAYLATANRAKDILEKYSNTNRVETALVVMAASYDKLGLTDLRNDARRVLKKNYPNSTMTVDDAFPAESWWKLW